MDEKKLLIITTHLPPDFKYGGVVSSGFGLIESFWRKSSLDGHVFRSVSVIATSPHPSSVVDFFRTLGLNVRLNVFKTRFMQRDGVSLGLLFNTPIHVVNADHILINGVFTAPVTSAIFFSWLFRKNYTLFFRGGIDPIRVKLSGSRKKYLYMRFLKFIIPRSKCTLAATSVKEMNDIKNQFPFANVLVGLNGLDPLFSKQVALFKKKREVVSVTKEFDILFLSRVSKEKGLDMLIAATKQLAEKFIEKGIRIKLKVAGPLGSGGYLIHNLPDSVEYLGPIYGTEKIDLYYSSSLFVLPSLSENFGNVVLEAMCCGTHCLTTNNTIWSEVPSIEGLTVTDAKVEAIKAAIENTIIQWARDPIKFQLVGDRLARYSKSEFNWDNTTDIICSNLIA